MQEQALHEHTDAVAAALAENAGALRAFVRARVPSEEVEDLIQRIALQAVERAPSLRDPSRARAWLFQLHRNAIVDATRQRSARQRMRQKLQSDAAALVGEAAGGVDTEACRCSLVQADRLGGKHAEILSLVDVMGHSPAEAADLLGISTNNATVRLHRARKALRKRMREHCGVVSASDCVDCRCTEVGCCAD